MPHIIVEYSANLDGRVDMHDLCVCIRDAAMASGSFELGAIRVRTLRCDTYVIADDLPDNAFINITLKMGKGRSVEDRKKAGEMVFGAVSERLETLFETPHFALSFYIEELEPEMSWKKNAIHPRLRTR